MGLGSQPSLIDDESFVERVKVAGDRSVASAANILELNLPLSGRLHDIHRAARAMAEANQVAVVALVLGIVT